MSGGRRVEFVDFRGRSGTGIGHDHAIHSAVLSFLGQFIRRIVHSGYPSVSKQGNEFFCGHRSKFRGLNQSEVAPLEQAQCKGAVYTEFQQTLVERHCQNGGTTTLRDERQVSLFRFFMRAPVLCLKSRTLKTSTGFIVAPCQVQANSSSSIRSRSVSVINPVFLRWCSKEATPASSTCAASRTPILLSIG